MSTTYIKGCEVWIARMMTDWLRAMELVYGQYLEKGLIDSNPFGVRGTESDLWTGTQKLLCEGSQSLGTLTIIMDSDEHGLPMGAVYESELDSLRREGRKLVELSALVIVAPDMRRSLGVQVSLFALMYHYALQQAVSDLVIAVHPKHAGFYEDTLGFERIGIRRPYPYANKNPAVALRHDLNFWRLHWKDLKYGDLILNKHTFLPNELRPAELDLGQKLEKFGGVIESNATQLVPN